MVILRFSRGSGGGGANFWEFHYNTDEFMDNLEFWGYFMIFGLTPVELQREYHPPQNETTSRLSAFISANNNTIDGATLRARLNLGFANQIITFDQATGNFIDITNIDLVTNADGCGARYDQGDNNLILNNLGIRFALT